MSDIDKKSLTERDICTKFINPALESAGWDLMRQIREQYYFTDGQVLVKGKTVKRGDRKFVDYLLFYKSNLPLAVIEAKDNSQTIGSGMQQGLGYAESLDVPFVFSTNGDGFLLRGPSDSLASAPTCERNLAAGRSPDHPLLLGAHSNETSIDIRVGNATLPIPRHEADCDEVSSEKMHDDAAEDIIASKSI